MIVNLYPEEKGNPFDLANYTPLATHSVGATGQRTSPLNRARGRPRAVVRDLIRDVTPTTTVPSITDYPRPSSENPHEINLPE
jgi:hypothetical protein